MFLLILTACAADYGRLSYRTTLSLAIYEAPPDMPVEFLERQENALVAYLARYKWHREELAGCLEDMPVVFRTTPFDCAGTTANGCFIYNNWGPEVIYIFPVRDTQGEVWFLPYAHELLHGVLLCLTGDSDHDHEREDWRVVDGICK